MAAYRRVDSLKLPALLQADCLYTEISSVTSMGELIPFFTVGRVHNNIWAYVASFQSVYLDRDVGHAR